MFQTNVVEQNKTHFVFVCFSPKIVSSRENLEKYCAFRNATDDNIIRRVCIACWIPTATDIHPKYVILITIPRQQWLGERPSLICTHTASLVRNFDKL